MQETQFLIFHNFWINRLKKKSMPWRWWKIGEKGLWKMWKEEEWLGWFLDEEMAERNGCLDSWICILSFSLLACFSTFELCKLLMVSRDTWPAFQNKNAYFFFFGKITLKSFFFFLTKTNNDIHLFTLMIKYIDIVQIQSDQNEKDNIRINAQHSC